MKPKRIYLNRVEGDGSDKIWSEEPVSVCDYVQNGEYINLSQVWHDASEEPKCGKAILCLNKKGSINLLTNNNKLIYTLTHMDAGVDKWAYINDLLPKQFGNSKQVKGGEQ